MIQTRLQHRTAGTSLACSNSRACSNDHRFSSIRTRAVDVKAPMKTNLETGRSVKFVEYDSEGFFTVRGRMELSAPLDTVYSILADYNNCNRVYHNISKSIVEEVKGQDPKQELTVAQVGGHQSPRRGRVQTCDASPWKKCPTLYSD